MEILILGIITTITTIAAYQLGIKSGKRNIKRQINQMTCRDMLNHKTDKLKRIL
jgi:hypothetical protein